MFEDEVRGDLGCDVECVEYGEAAGILVVGDVQGLFQTEDLRVADIGAIEEGAEEEKGEDGEDSGRETS